MRHTLNILLVDRHNAIMTIYLEPLTDNARKTATRARGAWGHACRDRFGYTGNTDPLVVENLMNGRALRHRHWICLTTEPQHPWHIQISAPNEAAWAYAIAQPDVAERIEGAHRHAVGAVLYAMSTYVLRVNGPCSELIAPLYVTYDQRIGREGEPVLHDHIIMAGYLKTGDGFGAITIADGYLDLLRAVYDAEMIYRLGKLGFKTMDEDGNFVWDAFGSVRLPAGIVRRFSEIRTDRPDAYRKQWIADGERMGLTQPIMPSRGTGNVRKQPSYPDIQDLVAIARSMPVPVGHEIILRLLIGTGSANDLLLHTWAIYGAGEWGAAGTGDAWLEQGDTASRRHVPKPGYRNVEMLVDPDEMV